jgi:hypothetical protein
VCVPLLWADNDWVFEDLRFQLADGSDQVLLAFLAHMAHPLVQPDTEQATKLVTRLNSLLAPDGWELRTRARLEVAATPTGLASSTGSAPCRLTRADESQPLRRAGLAGRAVRWPAPRPPAVAAVAQPWTAA